MEGRPSKYFPFGRPNKLLYTTQKKKQIFLMIMIIVQHFVVLPSRTAHRGTFTSDAAYKMTTTDIYKSDLLIASTFTGKYNVLAPLVQDKHFW